VSETSQALASPQPVSLRRVRRAAALALTAILLGSLIPLGIGGVQALTAGDYGSLLFYLLFFVLPANLGLVGALLTVRRPNNRIGWLLLASGVLTALAFASGEYGTQAVTGGYAGAPLVQAADWVAMWAFTPAIGMLVVFLPLLYPDGRLLGPRWRALVAVGVFGVAAATLGAAVVPGPMGTGGPDNPFPASEPLLSGIETISTFGNLLAPPVFLLAFASLLIRFRRAARIERQQIKWLLFVSSIAAVAFASSILGIGPISDAAWLLGLVTIATLPLAIGLAIMRYGLYEIDRIVNRALVYGAVSAILAGVFAAATALAQRVFISVAGQSSDAAIVLETLVVVAVYAPVRKRVEAVVDRYFKYDQRAYGPYLDELRRLLNLIEPHRAAERLAREAMVHTGAAGVAVTAGDGSVLAAAGRWPSEPSIALPIDVDRSPLAAVLVGARPDGKPHPPGRLAELADAAAVAALTLIAGAATDRGASSSSGATTLERSPGHLPEPAAPPLAAPPEAAAGDPVETSLPDDGFPGQSLPVSA
jgi:hypothetical protein